MPWRQDKDVDVPFQQDPWVDTDFYPESSKKILEPAVKDTGHFLFFFNNIEVDA